MGTHSYKFKKYRECFVGTDGTSWLCNRFRVTRATAVDLGQRMMDAGLVECMVGGSNGKFTDSGLLYRFTSFVFASAGTTELKTTHILVVLPDGVEKRLEVDTSQVARLCCEKVAEAIGLKHGVAEWALAGSSGWLSQDLPVADQWSEIDGPLRLSKKYFHSDAALPDRCLARTLLYHHVKSLVASGTYICTVPQCIKFAALGAQILYGDRDPSKHGPGVLRLHEFMPVAFRVHEAEVLDLWACLKGKSEAEAILDYTRSVVNDVPTFGVTRFPVTELTSSSSKGTNKVQSELGLTGGSLFRIADGSVVEQIRLDDVRAWNFTPKTIEFEFAVATREKYVAGTPRGREILALLSENQYFARMRQGNLESVRIHYYLDPQTPSFTRSHQIEVSVTVGDLIASLVKNLTEDRGIATLLGPEYYSIRTSSRWISREEKLGGLRETELWFEPRTELHLAAEQGDLTRVETLLGSCPIDARDVKMDTALHLAVRKHHKLVILALLDAGAATALTNADNQPPIGDALDLSKCGIVRLPVGLAKCPGLRRLDLSNNQIVTLPLEFADASSMEIFLDGNPLLAIPSSVKRGGLGQIRRFLKETATPTVWRRVKIVLWGPSGSGKTSVVQALRNCSGLVVPTPGLVVSDELELVPDVELRIFDFSGSLQSFQNLFYSHQRSVHVIVVPLNDAITQAGDRIRTILSHGASSIVVVLTHAEDQDSSSGVADSVVRDLQALAPAVVGVVVVDARDSLKTRSSLVGPVQEAVRKVVSGVDSSVPQAYKSLHAYLGRCVEQDAVPEQAPLVSRLFHNPLSDFVSTKKQLRLRLGAIASWTEFEILASDCFVDRASFSQAATFLFEIGSIGFHQNDTGRFTVLDPVLVARRLWQLLNFRTANLHGIVPMDAVRAMWSDASWDSVQSLLLLMQSLDLCVAFDVTCVFVPFLLDAPEIGSAWLDMKLQSRHVTEWRLGLVAPPVVLQATMVRLLALNRLQVHAAWKNGMVLYDAADQGALFVRLELVSEGKKVLLTVAVRPSPPTEPPTQQRVAKLQCGVADTVAATLKSFEATLGKYDRYVRASASSDQKAVLVRHADLLDYRAKGKTKVPIKGVAIPLEELLLSLPAQDLASSSGVTTTNTSTTTTSAFVGESLQDLRQRAMPPIWKRATTAGLLVNCMVLVARTCCMAHDAFVLMKDMMTNADLVTLLPRVDQFPLWQSLEGLARKHGKLNGCVSLLIECGKRLCHTVVSLAGGRATTLSLSTALRSASLLNSDAAICEEIVGFINASQLGPRLDPPSRAMAASLVMKFATAAQTLAKQTDESGGGDAWKKEQRERARVVSKYVAARVRLLRAFAAALTSPDALYKGLLTCSALQSKECAELATLLSLRSAESKERSAPVVRSLEAALKQLRGCMSCCLVSEEGGSPAFLALSLQHAVAYVEQFAEPQASLSDFHEGAQSVSRLHRELRGKSEFLMDEGKSLSLVNTLMHSVGDTNMCLFDRLRASFALGPAIETQAESLRLLKDGRVLLLARIKECLQRVNELICVVLLDPTASKRGATWTAVEATNAGMEALLESLPGAKSATSLSTLVHGQRANWNALIGACDYDVAAAGGARARFRQAVATARHAVLELLQLVEQERRVQARRVVEALINSLRNALLVAQLEGASKQADVAAARNAWMAAAHEMEQVLSGANQAATEDHVLKAMVKAGDALRALALKTPSAAEALLRMGLEFIMVLDAYCVAAFRFQDPHEAASRLQRAQKHLVAIRSSLEGPLSGIVPQIMASMKTELANLVARTVPAPPADTSMVQQVQLAVRSLECVHVFAQRVILSKSENHCAPPESDFRALLTAFGNLCVSLAYFDATKVRRLPLALPMMDTLVYVLLELLTGLQSGTTELVSLGTKAIEVIQCVGSLRAFVLDTTRMSKCAKLITQAFSGGDEGEGAAEELPKQGTEFIRTMEAAIFDCTVDATHRPLGLAEKIETVCVMTTRLVQSCRRAMRRSFNSFTVVQSFAKGRMPAMHTWLSSEDLFLRLASALSLLCEALESPDMAQWGKNLGCQGMLQVREDLAAIVAAEGLPALRTKTQAAAISFASALESVAPLKRDFVLAGLLVEVGHTLAALTSICGALLFDFTNVVLQQQFTKNRNQFVKALQALYQELHLVENNDLSPRESGASSGSSPALLAKGLKPRKQSGPATDVPSLEKERKPSTGDSDRKGSSDEPLLLPPNSNSTDSSSSSIAPLNLQRPAKEVPKTPPDSDAASPRSSPRPAPPAHVPSPRSAAGGGGGAPALAEPPRAIPSKPLPVAVDDEGQEDEEDEEEDAAVPISTDVLRVRAVFKCQAKTEDELSFQRGDVIIVAPGTDLSVTGIWRGRLEGTTGPFLQFASKYTKPL